MWFDGRISLVSAKDQSRLHQFLQDSLIARNVPRLCVKHVVRIWKGDILVADIEDLEKMDASEIHAWRLNAKEVSTPQNGEKMTFPIADGTGQIIWEETRF